MTTVLDSCPCPECGEVTTDRIPDNQEALFCFLCGHEWTGTPEEYARADAAREAYYAAEEARGFVFADAAEAERLREKMAEWNRWARENRWAKRHTKEEA